VMMSCFGVMCHAQGPGLMFRDRALMISVATSSAFVDMMNWSVMVR
jgi:hypothetical protein